MNSQYLYLLLLVHISLIIGIDNTCNMFFWQIPALWKSKISILPIFCELAYHWCLFIHKSYKIDFRVTLPWGFDHSFILVLTFIMCENSKQNLILTDNFVDGSKHIFEVHIAKVRYSILNVCYMTNSGRQLMVSWK